eukprot:TRINITY_DN22665_c0_g1_i1.p1 TRINITY_DN22665_c0_g1~~TRINITY_DN22665_c0_g1_i1.p1  ORF type:complete len:267 (-),score=66.45 TRINITY_DN22665_c0_g1_i1:411-1211(-)
MSSQTDAAMYDAKTILIPLAPLMGNPVGAAAALVTLRTLLESFGAISKVAEASSGDVLMVIYEDEKGADLARQAIYASAYGANYYGMAHGQDITNETQETMTPEVPSLSAAKAELDELAALKETFMCPTTATLGVASEHSNSADSDTVSDGTESSRETPTAAKLCSIQSFARSEVRWDLLANDKETRTVLQLRGLPRAMSQPGKFEALLTSKGLSELTKKVRVQPCKGSARFCTALVQAKDCEAVKKNHKVLPRETVHRFYFACFR